MRLIASHNTWHFIQEWIGLVAFAVVAVGFIAGSFLRGRNDQAKQAIDVASGEIEVLQVARTRLEEDLRASQTEIARLTGTVEQLRVENAELRQLVMMEKVPTPLAEFMSSMQTTMVELVRAVVGEFHTLLEANTDFWEGRIEERLHPIEQGISRLLSQKGEEP